MLNPADRWIWDFWHVKHNDLHHLFYLQAPKSLGNPDLRHRNATIGHATSRDLQDWTEHGTVLTPGSRTAPDATATWTGSVVRGDDGKWRMFYTGANFPSLASTVNIETICLAISDDLYTWHKDPTFAISADPTWYERLGSSEWPEEAWRDPWVYRESDGTWTMLITARVACDEAEQGGVVGRASSDDLAHWAVQAPLTEPGAGFAHLEVPQRVTLKDADFLLFSAHSSVISPARAADGADTGTWLAPWTADGINLADAINITGPALYSGRIIENDDGPVLLAFHINEPEPFKGGISDPIPVEALIGETITAADSL